MKLVKAAGSLGLATLALLASPWALAEDSGWYGGASVGSTSTNIDDAKINSGLVGNWFNSSTTVKDERSTGYKVFGGYRLNKNFALEGGYFDLGSFGYTATTVPAGTLNGAFKIKGINLDLVGTVPLTDKFSAFARAGVTYARTRDSFDGTGAIVVTNPNPSKHDTNYKLGLGLQYALTKSLALRAELERYRVNDALGNKGNVNLVSVGLSYSFGSPPPPVCPGAPGCPPPPPVCPGAPGCPPPPPVCPGAPGCPPPPPVCPGAPGCPPPKPCTLSASELFKFDSAELKMPQSKLDEIAVTLGEKREIKEVVITGHTDHLGSEQYNQKLSERRAQAVKAYLSSKGVEASRLTAQGKGEANPVVTTCTDKKLEALIQCLEPNRRVEVEKLTFACPAK